MNSNEPDFARLEDHEEGEIVKGVAQAMDLLDWNVRPGWEINGVPSSCSSAPSTGRDVLIVVRVTVFVVIDASAVVVVRLKSAS